MESKGQIYVDASVTRGILQSILDDEKFTQLTLVSNMKGDNGEIVLVRINISPDKTPNESLFTFKVD